MLGSVGRALRHRNYRLFFFGQGISLVGTWLTRVATAWLVYRLTRSAVLLGLVGFAGQIPTFVFAPLAGVWVDRANRHKILVWTQALAAAQSAALAIFTLTGTITIAHVLVLSALQGVINAADMPARQAFLSEMIEERQDLPNAIALNSSMVNGARLLGPSIAGVLIAWVGEGWCFAVDAVSYLAVIASLLMMHVALRPRRERRTGTRQELLDGFRYVKGFLPLRSVLLLLALVSLMGMPYTVLMPIIAVGVLHGGPHALGWLMGAIGVGALAGALYLASRQTVLGLGRVIGWSAVVFGVGLAVFAESRWLWLSVVLVVIPGGAMMVQMAASNTILQTLSDEDKRGRVMSFYAMSFFGAAPFGSLFAGFLAERIGAPATIVVGGAACVAGGLWFLRMLPALRGAARPVYRRLGILPAEGPEGGVTNGRA